MLEPIFHSAQLRLKEQESTAEDVVDVASKVEKFITDAVSKDLVLLFSEVAKGNRNVVDIMNHVANSCKQQSLGINEINHSTATLTKLTQKHARSSDASSESAVVLLTQGNELKKQVSSLKDIIEGGNTAGSNGSKQVS